MGKLLPSHCQFQRDMAEKYFNKKTKFVNIGCKEDPAGLGEWPNCINLDAVAHEVGLSLNLQECVYNFVEADYLEWKCPEKMGGMVLAEVLEHCTMEIGYEMMKKIHEDLLDHGLLILTIPQDHRTKAQQLQEQGNRTEQFFEVRPGITSWHQTVWTKELLDMLFEDVGFNIIEYDTAWWWEDRGIFWHLIVLEKV